MKYTCCWLYNFIIAPNGWEQQVKITSDYHGIIQQAIRIYQFCFSNTSRILLTNSRLDQLSPWFIYKCHQIITPPHTHTHTHTQLNIIVTSRKRHGASQHLQLVCLFMFGSFFRLYKEITKHYSDVIMSAMVSQITPASGLFTQSFVQTLIKENIKFRVNCVRGIHRWPVNFSHKRPVTQKMFPFDDVIMVPPVIGKSSAMRKAFLCHDTFINIYKYIYMRLQSLTRKPFDIFTFGEVKLHLVRVILCSEWHGAWFV